MQKFIAFLLLFLVGFFAYGVYADNARAQYELENGQIYTVKENDTLSKIAQVFYEQAIAYPKIVTATNHKAARDRHFRVIHNPDVIFVGQKLWLPTRQHSSAENSIADEGSEHEVGVDAEALIVVGEPPVEDKTLSFLVMGDMPYSDKENKSLSAPEGELFKAMQSIQAPVLVHYGDLKSGGKACTDDLLIARQAQMAAFNPYRVVYTPGDNDWTDCDRRFLGKRFDELERLDFLRQLFFSGKGLEMSSGLPDLLRQEGLPENAMWTINHLRMGTLHITGTNNGREQILKSDKQVALDAVDKRDRLNQQWLAQLFASAEDANGVVIVFQADIYRPGKRKPACTAENRSDCDAFSQIRDAIEQQAAAYGKPVLVVHGDTNAYCLNQISQTATNLWRLNGPGDFKLLDAAQVYFDPEQARPFKALTVLGKKELPDVCDYSR